VPEPIPVARIDRATGEVLNVEMAWPAWVADHADDPDYLYVPYTEDQPAIIGQGYDLVAGFDPAAGGGLNG